MNSHSFTDRCSVEHVDAGILSEESVRDQLSAAEELCYIGHQEPALVAAGAALEGALRRRGAALAGEHASVGALLEALLATGVLHDDEYELVGITLNARDRLAQGYAPLICEATEPDLLSAVLALTHRLLEAVVPFALASTGNGSLPRVR
ncbi:MAG: hypothetical protein QOC77_2692 [Thermoleophilaceae bacterium]|nr:hypothetical protein [Thermoleophilaceae bacterium]MEA2470628.1 hypothetical protein [Thermoleophilaceae bacterium]